uniref:Thioredoxin-like fold domain-containing protein n=1 Tax=Favella ehrenbergii TaxID=182087 RepID=A0A7S3HXP9_9SPIT|mmetsp:Transcript_17307/g.21831  ORF Transcript_17307/g.21831 Transcript_17307/m.21831 type:complete len:131 (+) Transcript_17307:327-719(+)
MDMCTADSTQCYNNEYRNFSYDQLETVLSMKDTSKDDFITYWSQAVASELGVDASAIEGSYSDPARKTDLDLRSMWKYAAQRGVFGTPSAYVNGVRLDDVPFTVPGWMRLLNQIYDSQVGHDSQVTEILN